MDDLLASLRPFISYYRDCTYTSAAPSYAAGSAAFCPGAADLEFALNQAYNGRVELSDELTAAVANETVRMDALKKELADQRAKDGAFQWVLGAGAVIVGVAAIVVTLGAATPIVVAAAVAGSCSIAYGVSNMYEAKQDIEYGLAGDPFTTAVNPIRDTVFMGNQSAYDTWGTISVGAAGLFIPIGGGLNAAKTAGVLGIKGVTRVVGVEVSKYAVSAGAGIAGSYAGTYYGTEYFGAEAGRWIGLGTGLVTGIGVGYGVNGLAKTFNLNGLLPGAAAKTAGDAWYNADGSLNLPPDYGAIKGTEKIIDLQPDSKLGRFGTYGKNSDFLTAPGSAAETLSLPPYTDTSIYHEFTVLKPIPGVTQSTVAPWGGSVGGGMQYRLPMTIEDLIFNGYIK